VLATLKRCGEQVALVLHRLQLGTKNGSSGRLWSPGRSLVGWSRWSVAVRVTNQPDDPAIVATLAA
jgi:hypothetical protein